MYKHYFTPVGEEMGHMIYLLALFCTMKGIPHECKEINTHAHKIRYFKWCGKFVGFKIF